MSLQGPGVEGAAMSHHAQEVEFGPLHGSHREGDGWTAWGEGEHPSLEVMSWRPIFEGFWVRVVWVIAAEGRGLGLI